MLEFGKDLLDRVKVRAVGGQEPEPCSCGTDGSADRGSFVTSEVVQNHDVAGMQGRDQNFLDIGSEYLRVDPSPWSLGPVAFPWLDVEHPRRVDPVVAQGGEECHGVPVSERGFGLHAVAAPAPAT